MLLQSYARMMPHRAKFVAQCAHLFASRRAARLAALEASASVKIQAPHMYICIHICIYGKALGSLYVVGGSCLLQAVGSLRPDPADDAAEIDR